MTQEERNLLDNYYKTEDFENPAYKISKVTIDKINSVIENMKDENFYGKYYAEEKDGTWVAVDNSTGDAWTEEFSSEENAIKWLEDTSLNPEDLETKTIKVKLEDLTEGKPELLTEENAVKVTLEQSIEFNIESEDSELDVDESEAMEKIEIDDTEVADELLDYLKNYSYDDEYKPVYNAVRRVTVDSSSYDKIKCVIELGTDFDDMTLQDIFSDFISEVVLEDEQYSGFDSYDEHSTHTVYYDDWSDEVEDDYHREVEFTFTTRTVGDQTIEIKR